jgi:ubiquinone/menaquinone biosynthesis C-methylase UbiE
VRGSQAFWLKKTMNDIHELSGRGRSPVLTEFINRRILEELAVKPHDRLVDIGCGDGTLLRYALQSGVQDAAGFNGTEEEAAPLRALGLNVGQACSDALPLPDRCASVVVCNAVLLIVAAEKIPASLREIARIAEPGARIGSAKSRAFASLPAFAALKLFLKCSGGCCESRD